MNDVDNQVISMKRNMCCQKLVWFVFFDYKHAVESSLKNETTKSCLLCLA
jgi:hypothetical protein